MISVLMHTVTEHHIINSYWPDQRSVHYVCGLSVFAVTLRVRLKSGEAIRRTCMLTRKPEVRALTWLINTYVSKETPRCLKMNITDFMLEWNACFTCNVIHLYNVKRLHSKLPLKAQLVGQQFYTNVSSHKNSPATDVVKTKKETR